ncbi:MAG: IclR family transcriptional regulator [Bradyrhizobium sp.]|nr:IclR family transcriptional regulator [Bradyrhizobium sp.]
MNIAAVNTASRKPQTEPQGVGLLIKVFQILALFTDERSAWTQTELAQETGLARSTLSRLVRFLCARSFLMEQRGRYVLGYAAIDLGRRAQLQFNLVDLCYDLLEEVAQVTGETAILGGYDENRNCVVCLAQIPSRHGGLRVFENIGNTYPVYAGATSKAILAFLSDAQQSLVLGGTLTPVNPAVRFTAKKLREEIADIRAKKFVVTHEETYPGVGGIGVPLLTPRGQSLGSIALGAPQHRLDQKTVKRWTELLLDISRRAAQRIAGSSTEGPEQ